MTLMFMLKNNGPNIEPWGTPVLFQFNLFQCFINKLETVNK